MRNRGTRLKISHQCPNLCTSSHIPTDLILLPFLELPVTTESGEVPIAAPPVARACSWESRRGLQDVWSLIPAGSWFIACLSPEGCLQNKVRAWLFGWFFFQEPFPRNKTDNTETGLALSVLHCPLWLCQKTALPMFKIPTHNLRNLVLDFCYGSRTGLLS